MTSLFLEESEGVAHLKNIQTTSSVAGMEFVRRVEASFSFKKLEMAFWGFFLNFFFNLISDKLQKEGRYK